MEPLVHTKFKLNENAFLSAEALNTYALKLVENGNNYEASIGRFIVEWLNGNDFIKVRTSGSTGVPKEVLLKKIHVFNSANATNMYFDLKEDTKALLCLSAEYIAGKMMLVRAMIGGWNLHAVAPKKNPLKKSKDEFDFTAMVPYQAFYSLADLPKVKKLIIGGGALSNVLEKELQHIKTAVFATYGMTETISHIAVRPINGAEKSPVFSALPKVIFSQTENDCLQIHASEISEETVVTNDVVELLSPTSFKFLGRIDTVINTGGVKVHPELVEEKLSQHIHSPFIVASEKNEALGDQLILIVERSENLKLEDFSEAFKVLSKYEIPKKIYKTAQFIYTDTGKIKRGAIIKKTEIIK